MNLKKSFDRFYFLIDIYLNKETCNLFIFRHLSPYFTTNSVDSYDQ